MRKSSLRSRLILGFSMVTVPLIVLLILNNWYAMGVVQKQVAGSNKNLITVNVNQMDQKLTEAEKYLLKTSLQEPDLLAWGSYPSGSDEATYASVNLFNRLSQDIPYYADMDAFFGYRSASGELIFAAQQSMSYEQKEAVRAKLAKLMGDVQKRQGYTRHWEVVEVNGQYAMFRILEADNGSFIGAWVELNRFLKPFSTLDMGEQGRVFIASSSGTVLAHTANLSLNRIPNLQLNRVLAEDRQLYHTVSFDKGDEKGMIVSQKSQMADIHLAVLLPVKSLLEQLPVFQWLIYLTPALAIVILLLFLFYLERSMMLPVHRLLKGMRLMRSGNFNTRLEASNLSEFNDINGAFNQMSDEIETLKIDIYEEKLKTHKAELRHLQAQIHPHFFTNCLNLIYNLAQVKNIALVQKLTLHLVQHLRFTIRTHVTAVPLQEELTHIRNYLSIQELRFPATFEYELEMLEEVQHLEIPPLTIQPFVENAMEHGFCYKDEEPFRIQITMRIEQSPYSDGACLTIQIADNGMGFAPPILERLRSGDYFRHEFDEHIGIWNVHHRCKLYYDAGTTILFDNDQQGGAVVTLRLPLDKRIQAGRDSHV